MKKPVILFFMIIIACSACKKHEDNIQWINPVEEIVECPCSPDSNSFYYHGTKVNLNYTFTDKTYVRYGEYNVGGYKTGGYEENHLNFYFGQEPQTGRYKTITTPNSSWIDESEVYVELDLCPSIWLNYHRSAVDDYVYVINENGYITVSFCDMLFRDTYGIDDHFTTDAMVVAKKY